MRKMFQNSLQIRCMLLYILHAVFILGSATSLNIVELRVPGHVPLGTRAQLSCGWRLAPHDVLYSVKWYKDGHEFFRHVPRDTEPRRKFPLPGVDVEVSDTSGSNITLAESTLLTSGRYRCEVSGEKPLFLTVSSYEDLLVVAPPDHAPVISGLRPRYHIGDRASVNCTSGWSRPATTLTWFINGEPAPGDITTNYQTNKHGLVTSISSLKFNVKEKHFTKSLLHVKCLATIASTYWKSNEEVSRREEIKYETLFISKKEKRRHINGSSTNKGFVNIFYIFYLSWNFYHDYFYLE